MDLNTRLKRREDILTADMNGSAVTMDPRTGKYYNFGEIGGSIWNLLAEERTFDQLLGLLAEEYNTDKDVCRSDTEDFLLKLKNDGLLEKWE